MKVLRPISSIFLAILVLVSSTSFMVGFHFCMGEVENVALFSKAASCQKESSLPACHRHTEAPCCADQTFYHSGDDIKSSVGQTQVVALGQIDIEQPLVVISEIIPLAPTSRLPYFNYDPPLRSWDLTVEHHVFLI
jgi:hypothetical protein